MGGGGGGGFVGDFISNTVGSVSDAVSSVGEVLASTPLDDIAVAVFAPEFYPTYAAVTGVAEGNPIKAIAGAYGIYDQYSGLSDFASSGFSATGQTMAPGISSGVTDTGGQFTPTSDYYNGTTISPTDQLTNYPGSYTGAGAGMSTPTNTIWSPEVNQFVPQSYYDYSSQQVAASNQQAIQMQQQYQALQAQQAEQARVQAEQLAQQQAAAAEQARVQAIQQEQTRQATGLQDYFSKNLSASQAFQQQEGSGTLGNLFGNNGVTVRNDGMGGGLGIDFRMPNDPSTFQNPYANQSYPQVDSSVFNFNYSNPDLTGGTATQDTATSLTPTGTSSLSSGTPSSLGTPTQATQQTNVAPDVQAQTQATGETVAGQPDIQATPSFNGSDGLGSGTQDSNSQPWSEADIGNSNSASTPSFTDSISNTAGNVWDKMKSGAENMWDKLGTNTNKFLDKGVDQLMSPMGLYSLYNMYNTSQMQKQQANNNRNLADQAQKQANPFASQQPMYQQKLADTYNNPQAYMQTPEFMAEQNRANSANQRRFAAQGLRSNPLHMANATAASVMDQFQKYRAGLVPLTGANANPAGGLQAQMAYNTAADKAALQSRGTQADVLSQLFKLGV